jgi:hypothetical protein
MNIILIALCILALVFLFSSCRQNVREGIFGEVDQDNALSALDDLNSKMLGGRIEEVDADYLKKYAHQIYLAKLKDVGIANEDAEKEHMTFFHPVNTTYWPYYHYSAPYQYENGGAWPPGMKSRLYNWQPGFGTSGWSYWMRPGISYNRWPRSRWVKQNGSYYFINNGGQKDRQNDFTDNPS